MATIESDVAHLVVLWEHIDGAMRAREHLPFVWHNTALLEWRRSEFKKRPVEKLIPKLKVLVRKSFRRRVHIAILHAMQQPFETGTSDVANAAAVHNLITTGPIGDRVASARAALKACMMPDGRDYARDDDCVQLANFVRAFKKGPSNALFNHFTLSYSNSLYRKEQNLWSNIEDRALGDAPTLELRMTLFDEGHWHTLCARDTALDILARTFDMLIPDAQSEEDEHTRSLQLITRFIEDEYAQEVIQDL